MEFSGQLHAQAALTAGRKCYARFMRGLGGPQKIFFNRLEKEKNSFPTAGIQPPDL
jgi:hypothetical protein